MKLYRNVDKHNYAVVHLGVCMWIYSVFVEKLPMTVKFAIFNLCSCSSKVYDLDNETFQECCSGCVVVHLGFLLWIYCVLSELWPLIKQKLQIFNLCRT
jgi:hypothetical protein